MQLTITLKHHDWKYVEERGGPELLTHLRSAGPRAEFRRTAVERAFDRFCTAETEQRAEPEVGGLGLIVVQRAVLAAEDLGGLLYALRGTDPWTDLRAATIDAVDAAYQWATTQSVDALERVFVLPDRATLDQEGLPHDLIPPLLRLRALEISRWTQMAETVGSLWASLYGIAKAMMHGFPIFAGSLIFEPPGGGSLAEGIRASRSGRSAVAAVSRQVRPPPGGEIRTDRLPVALDRKSVERYCRGGKMAARLYAEICSLQAESRMNGHALSVPLRMARHLDRDSRRMVEEWSTRKTDDG